MKKVLIIGFEPFGGDAINPALEAIKRLDTIVEGLKLIAEVSLNYDSDIVMAGGQIC